MISNACLLLEAYHCSENDYSYEPFFFELINIRRLRESLRVYFAVGHSFA